MASWRLREPARIEPPAWYRDFDPGAWDEPDGQELSMTGGRDVRDWPGHEIHAHRRWAEAKHAYRRENPALASQEFDDLVSGERAARRAERQAFPGGSMEP